MGLKNKLTSISMARLTAGATLLGGEKILHCVKHDKRALRHTRLTAKKGPQFHSFLLLNNWRFLAICMKSLFLRKVRKRKRIWNALQKTVAEIQKAHSNCSIVCTRFRG